MDIMRDESLMEYMNTMNDMLIRYIEKPEYYLELMKCEVSAERDL